MAKVKLNPVLEQIRGQIGDLVFKRYNDDVIVARKPDMEGVTPTPAQLANRERFRQAAIYGRLVMADAEKRVIYEDAAKKRGKPVFAMMVGDFFNTPEISEVDLAGYTGQVGDPIVVMAHDDFEVTGVQLSLTDAEGQVLEHGAAVEAPAKSGRWVYTTTVPNDPGALVHISVEVSDLPGGKGVQSVDKTL